MNSKRRKQIQNDRGLIWYVFLWIFLPALLLLSVFWLAHKDMVIASAGGIGVSAESAGEKVIPVPSLPVTEKDWILERLMKEGIDTIRADKIIQCESGYNADAIHINRHSADLGEWQLNTRLYPDISNADKLDYKKSTEYAIKIIKRRGFKPWLCDKIID